MLMVEKAIVQRDKSVKFILYGNHNIEQI
jgi:hypothetical protein